MDNIIQTRRAVRQGHVITGDENAKLTIHSVDDHPRTPVRSVQIELQSNRFFTDYPERPQLTVNELRELSRLFSEIADVLEG